MTQTLTSSHGHLSAKSCTQDFHCVDMAPRALSVPPDRPRMGVPVMPAPCNFFTVQHVAILITAVAAAATTYMAIATRGMAYATKQLATVTEKSVMTAALSLEREKDALMPVIEIQCLTDNESTVADYSQFTLVLRNRGSGPGFIREITARADIGSLVVHRSPMRTVVLAVGEEVSDKLGGSGEPPEPSYLSSVSVWYQDVYSRWFRSRLLYGYEGGGSPTRITGVRTFKSEFVPLDQPPELSWDDHANGNVFVAEGGRPVPYRPLGLDENWHTLASLVRVRDIRVPGGQLTGGAPVEITEMGFWRDSRFPQFVVRSGSHSPFLLDFQDGAIPPVVARSAGGYPTRWISGKPDTTTPPLDEFSCESFGLVSLHDLPDAYEALYGSLYVAVSRLMVSHNPSSS